MFALFTLNSEAAKCVENDNNFDQSNNNIVHSQTDDSADQTDDSADQTDDSADQTDDSADQHNNNVDQSNDNTEQSDNNKNNSPPIFNDVQNDGCNIELQKHCNNFIQKRNAAKDLEKIKLNFQFLDTYLEKVCRNPNISVPTRLKRILTLIKEFGYGKKTFDYFLHNRKILQSYNLLSILFNFYIEYLPVLHMVEKLVNKKVKDSILKIVLIRALSPSCYEAKIIEVINSGLLYKNYGLTLKCLLSDYCYEGGPINFIELMPKLSQKVFDCVLPITLFTKNMVLIDSYVSKLRKSKVISKLDNNAPLDLLLLKAFQYGIVCCFRKTPNINSCLNQIYKKLITSQKEENIYEFCCQCALYWPDLYLKITQELGLAFMYRFLAYLNKNFLFKRKIVYLYNDTHSARTDVTILNKACDNEIYYMASRISSKCLNDTMESLGHPINDYIAPR